MFNTPYKVKITCKHFAIGSWYFGTCHTYLTLYSTLPSRSCTSWSVWSGSPCSSSNPKGGLFLKLNQKRMPVEHQNTYILFRQTLHRKDASGEHNLNSTIQCCTQVEQNEMRVIKPQNLQSEFCRMPSIVTSTKSNSL